MNCDHEKKAVIFDMDGVIINSEPIHFEVNQKIFNELDIDISSEEYESLVGTSLPEMWLDLKKRFLLSDDVEDLVKTHRQMIKEQFKQTEKLEPIEGVTELIRELRKNSYLIALASSTSVEIIRLILFKMNLTQLFDAVRGGDQVTNGKPDPEIFLKTASDLECRSENCIVIEDSFNGVSAAKSAGMKCIGFRNPDSGNQDLSRADIMIDDFKVLTLSKIEELYG
jgi:HAD superfamily hydrolase (TIGR01509 family)